MVVIIPVSVSEKHWKENIYMILVKRSLSGIGKVEC